MLAKTDPLRPLRIRSANRCMNPAEGVFLYTPIPYFAIFVLLLYRHDLSRLRHPFRDDGSPRTWWVVLNHLSLLTAEQVAHTPSRRRELIPYAGFLSVSLILSLSWALRAFPVVWYSLVIVQGIAGIIIGTAAMRYLGAPPRRPYVDTLRYPRLGSRIRHFVSLTKGKRQRKATVNEENEQSDTAGVVQNTQEGAS